MPDLLIKFRINFNDADNFLCPYGPLMHRWLPNGKSDLIQFKTGNSDFILHGWFERRIYTNIMYATEERPKIKRLDKYEIDESQINRKGIWDSGILFCELKVKNIPFGEYDAIVNGRTNNENYVRFGKKILPIFREPLNNFIRILKFKHGQYWLNELPVYDSRREYLGNYYSHFQMMWSSNDGKNWAELLPTNCGITLRLPLPIDEDYHTHYITQHNWDGILEEIHNNFPPTASLNMMSKCRYYFEQGHIEHSVIYGIISLDEAMREVIRKKRLILDKKSRFFKEKVKRISSFNELITSEEITASLELYDVRNELVHRGIPPELQYVQCRIYKLLNVISKLVLNKYLPFPMINHGNKSMEPKEWDAIENK